MRSAPVLTYSGNVFERRLIEAYISENGTDPVTNEELSTDDLVSLKNARTVRPRAPTLTSIPSLLTVFQNEWDALALETYTVKQQLAQTRQELSTALYQHDAAVRVIARLSRERDEARDALSKVTMNGGPTSNGEAMQVDGQGLSEALIARVEETQEKYISPVVLSGSEANAASLDFLRQDENERYHQIGQMRRRWKHSNRKSWPNRCFLDRDSFPWTVLEIWFLWEVQMGELEYTQYHKGRS